MKRFAGGAQIIGSGQSEARIGFESLACGLRERPTWNLGIPTKIASKLVVLVFRACFRVRHAGSLMKLSDAWHCWPVTWSQMPTCCPQISGHWEAE